MDKLQMAHEYVMQHVQEGCDIDYDVLVVEAWKYADAMQAEWDSRINKDRPTVLQDEFQPTGYETPTDEWQPDWSQAPEWAKWWACDKCGDSYFYSYKPTIADDMDYWADHMNNCNGMAHHVNDCFGYQGDWRDSLRSRP